MVLMAIRNGATRALIVLSSMLALVLILTACRENPVALRARPTAYSLDHWVFDAKVVGETYIPAANSFMDLTFTPKDSIHGTVSGRGLIVIWVTPKNLQTGELGDPIAQLIYGVRTDSGYAEAPVHGAYLLQHDSGTANPHGYVAIAEDSATAAADPLPFLACLGLRVSVTELGGANAYCAQGGHTWILDTKGDLLYTASNEAAGWDVEFTQVSGPALFGG